MKTIFATILLLFTASSHADEWTKSDSVREATYLALHIADWGQTRNIVHRSNTGCDGGATCIEKNPILGRNPSISRVDTYFAITALAHVAISYALPKVWRQGWQYVSIGMEAAVVGHNYSLGLKVDF